MGEKHTGCAIPPAGWICTRDRGHEGPCAAQQTGFSVTTTQSMLVFEGGSLLLSRDGSGELSFREEDLDWDLDPENPVDYRTLGLPASEVLAIRDHLNRLFPPALATPTDTKPAGEGEAS